jgi:nicotinamidase/pyrazinamidase
MSAFDLVVATRDWHPTGHLSFASSHEGRKVGDHVVLNGIDQVLWPDHCVQHTQGAELVPALDRSRINRIFFKGTNPYIDSYSAFFDNDHQFATGLSEYLHLQGIGEIYLCGLATDYCVQWSAIDALKLGYRVTVIKDLCRAINSSQGDEDRALEEIRHCGGCVVVSGELELRSR